MDGPQHIQKAYEAIMNHDFEQAIESFQQALLLEPNNAEYHYKLSITYARSGKLDAALEHARIAHLFDAHRHVYKYQLDHLESLDLIRKAEVLLDKKQPQLDTALALIQRAIKLDPLTSEAYLLMAMIYAHKQEDDLALAAIQDVLKLEPGHHVAQSLLETYIHRNKDSEQSD